MILKAIISAIISFLADAFMRWQKDMIKKSEDRKESKENTEGLKNAQTIEDRRKANSDLANNLRR